MQVDVSKRTCIYSANNTFRIRSLQLSSLLHCIYSVPLTIGQHCVVIIIGTISCSSYIIQWNIPVLFLNATKCPLVGFLNKKLRSKHVFQYNSNDKAASPCKIIWNVCCLLVGFQCQMWNMWNVFQTWSKMPLQDCGPHQDWDPSCKVLTSAS